MLNALKIQEPLWQQCKYCGKEWSDMSFYINGNKVDKCPECRGYLHISRYSDELTMMKLTNDEKLKRDLYLTSNTLTCSECGKKCNELYLWSNNGQKEFVAIYEGKKLVNWKQDTFDQVSELCPECHYSHFSIEISRKLNNKENNKNKNEWKPSWDNL